jgi:hypothetical protein
MISSHLLIRRINQSKSVKRTIQSLPLAVERKLSGRSSIELSISLCPKLCLNEGFLRRLAQYVSIILSCGPPHLSCLAHFYVTKIFDFRLSFHFIQLCTSQILYSRMDIQWRPILSTLSRSWVAIHIFSGPLAYLYRSLVFGAVNHHQFSLCCEFCEL